MALLDADADGSPRSQLSAQRRALLAKRLQGALSSAPDDIQPLGDRATARLSFGQERLWFLHRLEPDSPFYNVGAQVMLEGPLDRWALARAFTEVLWRHEVLRTTIREIEAEPRPVVTPAALFTLPEADLRGLPPQRRPAAADACAQAVAERSFDLATGPLLRCLLLQLAAQSWRLVLCLHHVVADGWSLGVLGAEISAFYNAFAAGKPSPLPALPIQYRDFAAWQRDWLSGPLLDRQLAYWRAKLAGSDPLLDLPTDRPRPLAQSHRGATRHLFLPGPLTAGIAQLSGQESASPFMVLLAAWNALLGRYTGRHDILVGTPLANRTRRESEGLIGFFASTAVLKGDLGGLPSAVELVRRAREDVIDTLGHPDLPFERIVAELRPERALSHNPLFQVMFVLQSTPMPEMRMQGLTLTPEPLEGATSLFDLSLSFERRHDGLLGALEYRTDLFDPPSMERLLGHYRQLVESFAATPRRLAAELSLLSPGERHQALREWQETPQAAPGGREPDLRAGLGDDRCVHELILAQAARTPQAVALVHGSRRMSYRELASCSAHLAHELVRLGIGPESRVAICLHRSPEMIVAVLATLQAGGAYLPLDPSSPRERLAQVLEDAGAVVLLTEPRLRGLLPEMPATTILCLDPEAPFGADGAASAPPPRATPENLAYVIYTSGSTGRPKGVMVAHRSLGAVAGVMARRYGLAPGDQVLQFASLAFDVSAEEIFPTLASGATLVLRGEEMTSTPAAFAREVERLGLTVLNLPTPFWRELARVPDLSFGPTVRQLIIGSEAAHAETLAAWLATPAGTVPLLNAYGPTETTITAVAGELSRAPASREPPIGWPVERATAHVLDGEGEIAPPGLHGELHIGGPGVSRGYLGRPALTAERFLPDPWSPAPGARLYRTGDLVRRRMDGALEFLGRRDRQIKLRGFRIELGEIEAALRTCPGIRDAAVVARQEKAEPRIVAYVVSAEESPGSPAEWRQALQQLLPEPMVPSRWVTLAALPLNPSGKVDWRALPEPEEPSHVPPQGQAPGRTAVEEVVAAIWSDVLGVAEVGSEDDFFALGGHSLLATRVIARLRDVLQVELPLRDLFEHPTLSGLAARVELVRLLGSGAAAPPLQVAESRHMLPLSFAQQRLWFIDRLQPGEAQYNIPAALLVTGPLLPAALARALGEVERRHEALRTSFAERAGAPTQWIRPPRDPFPLPIVDLGGLPVELRREALSRLAREEAARPFDLAAGPVWRAALLRLARDEHALLLTLHHIASDGWSMSVLAHEVAELYGAAAAGRAPQLRDLPIQYADYAVWQREWLRGKTLARGLAHWRQRLAGAPAVLELPTDRPRPAVRSSRGGECALALPAPLGTELATCCRSESASLAMILMTGFAVLLHRCGGQRDLCIGSPFAGRQHLELEGLIGFFVNTLAVRVDLSGSPGFGAVLGLVRDAWLDAHLHQEVPFEKLVEHLAPERTLSHSPLVQAMFVFENASSPFELPGLAVSPLMLARTTAQFDLALTLGEAPAGLAGALSYSADLFDPATAGRLAAQLETLLTGALADTQAPISALPLLRTAERHQVLVELNDTATDGPEATCVHHLFERMAARSPEALAVVAEGESLTYAELERRANRLGHELRARGIGPDSLVGICAERSPDLVVALLAVLKAGGAYVPLDPDHPRDRLAWILEDAAVSVVLTQRRIAGRLPPHGAATLLLDEPLPGAGPDRVPPLAVAVGPENLAYVIYTSGSTGRPKGAMNSHRAVTNRLLWMPPTLGLTADELVLQKTPYSFDVSVWEIFCTLAVGARLVIAQPGGHRDPDYLAATVELLGITTLHFVPSMLVAFLEARGLEGCRSLRRVVVGGEALPPELAAAFHARLPWCELHNLYGPTETAIEVTAWRSRPAAVSGIVPIGGPISNVRIHLLDGDLRPVSLGVTGELYIAGTAVGRGYLGRADLTAERFLPDPLAVAPGERMYRSGDLARRRGDGTIEYLGRVDRQVKIRGFRIELGEIEAVLARHPDVREVAVLAQADARGDTFLVAYFVPRPGAMPATAELRRHAGDALPAYMVPWQLVELPAMPLTASGKVNYRALPAVGSLAADDAQGSDAPRTWMEELLCEIWADVLDLPKVGVHDDFFALGGHSLLMPRLTGRLREALGVDVPLRAVLGAPTVAGLSERLAEEMKHRREAEPPLVGSAPSWQPQPLSPAQLRFWLRRHEGGGEANLPLAARLCGVLDLAALRRSFDEIVRRHEALRTRFLEIEGEAVQLVDNECHMTVGLVDLSGLATERREEEREHLGGVVASHSFDLARAPLVSAWVVLLARDEHVLLMAKHHLVTDGWSEGIFFDELGRLYGAFRRGAPSPLPEPPLQYRDYVAWQRELLRGEIHGELLGWWQERLAGLPPLALPSDRPRPPLRSNQGGLRRRLLDRGLSAAVHELGRRESSTLFMTLLAAWAALLAAWCGQEDVAVTSNVANRRAETEPLIGLFTNLVALRMDLKGQPTFRQLLARVRGTVLTSFAHQELPFAELLGALQHRRQEGHNDLFPVGFTLQNTPIKPFEVPDLRVEPLALDTGTAPRDLILLALEPEDRLELLLLYRRDIFEEATIDGLLDRLAALLSAMVADPERPVPGLADTRRPGEAASRELRLTSWRNGTVAAELLPESLAQLVIDERE